MESKFAFLSSTRWWAVVIGAVSLYLYTKGIIGVPETTLIATITASFTLIRTVDRVSDKKVEAAEITAGVDKEYLEAV